MSDTALYAIVGSLLGLMFLTVAAFGIYFGFMAPTDAPETGGYDGTMLWRLDKRNRKLVSELDLAEAHVYLKEQDKEKTQNAVRRKRELAARIERLSA